MVWWSPREQRWVHGGAIIAWRGGHRCVQRFGSHTVRSCATTMRMRSGEGYCSLWVLFWLCYLNFWRGLAKGAWKFVTIFFLFVGFCDCREASMTGPVTKTQAEVVVPIVTRFIGACSTEQIRLAPDKCMRIWDLNILFCLIHCL